MPELNWEGRSGDWSWAHPSRGGTRQSGLVVWEEGSLATAGEGHRCQVELGAMVLQMG